MNIPKLVAEEESEHYKRVKTLMIKAGQECPDKPTIPSYEIRKLRAKLILEEAEETINALGFQSRCCYTLDELDVEPLGEYNKLNIKDVIDGCIDTIVVTTGTLISYGVKDVNPSLLVDLNNLDKFGPGGYRREDGKWIKPPGHKPPDLEAEIERQMKL